MGFFFGATANEEIGDARLLSETSPSSQIPRIPREWRKLIAAPFVRCVSSTLCWCFNERAIPKFFCPKSL